MTTEDYVRRAEFALRDLPWSMRRQLVAELRAHLDELPEGTDLGTPEEYVKEMRAAAGLAKRRGPLAFVRARRPRNLALAVLALILLGLVICAIAWVDGYQPIATGNTSYGPIGGHESPAGDGVYVVIRPGKRFRYGMTLWNRGRFTVRILGLAEFYQGHLPGMPATLRLLMSQPTTFAYGGIPTPYVRFQPFDLKPGEQRGLIFSGTYDNEPCGQLGSGSEWVEAIPVRFSFLWRSATVWVPLPERLAFDSTKSKACPKAKP